MATQAVTEFQRKQSLVGTSVPRIDLRLKVTGKALYTKDLKLQRMLHARIKRSPFPHARILKIDAANALKMPGVRAIVTANDFPSHHGEDLPALAQDEVLYAGQAIMGVAAESDQIAFEAVESIDVEYEQLPYVSDAELAMLPDKTPSVITHLDEKTESPNIAKHFKVRRGDVDRGFQKSDLVIENRYTTAMESHMQLEPITIVAQPDPDGGVTIWASTNGAHRMQAAVSNFLGIDRYRVRVRVPFLGGAFGGKEEQPLAAVCAMLALRSQRPVKLEMSREENFTASGVRHPSVIHVKDGIESKTGKILAREMRLVFDGGAFGARSNYILRHAVFTAVDVYDIPNMKLDVYRVYTNRVPGTPKRAPFVPQVVWANECQMDEIAAALKMDPVNLRLVNIHRNGTENAIGEPMEGVTYDECLTKVSESIGWPSKKQAGKEGSPWRTGRGVALGLKFGNGNEPYEAMVRIRETGKVEVWVGAVENGQGIFTGITQLVAEEFGINPEDVILMPFVYGTDSATSGLSQGASGSRQLTNIGRVVLIACAEAKKKVAERVSTILGARAGDIDVRGGYVFVKKNYSSSSGRKIKLGDLFTSVSGAKIATQYFVAGGGGFTGNGTWFKNVGELDAETGRVVGGTRAVTYYQSAAQAAEVSVNVETGQVRVHRIVAALDVGKAINPALVRAQIQGAVMMGLSAALSEELIISDGRITNPNLADYKILSSVDAPIIEPVIVESAYKDGPHGAKGMGEASIVATAAAIRNAIYDAAGVFVNDTPITPERVLSALSDKSSSTG